MQTKKDKTPLNKKGQPHGYWEDYYSNGQLWYKGNYVNGIRHGYWESYRANGQLHYKGKYANKKPVGLWFINGREIFYAD